MSPVLPNYLHARVSEPELVSYVIRDYNSSGHPFEGKEATI